MKSLLRVAVPVFSLTLLAGYVIYSHVTPNSPPPDPLGLSIDLTIEPEIIDFDGFIDDGGLLPLQKGSGGDLRIITSKSISQPVFSVARIRLPWETTRNSWNGQKGDPFRIQSDVRYEGHGINLSGFSRK